MHDLEASDVTSSAPKRPSSPFSDSNQCVFHGSCQALGPGHGRPGAPARARLGSSSPCPGGRGFKDHSLAAELSAFEATGSGLSVRPGSGHLEGNRGDLLWQLRPPPALRATQIKGARAEAQGLYVKGVCEEEEYLQIMRGEGGIRGMGLGLQASFEESRWRRGR